MKRSLKIVLILLLVITSGCGLTLNSLPLFSGGPRVVGLIISSSPTQPGVRGSVYGEGKSCEYDLLGILPLSGRLSTHEALQRAKDHAQSAVITDIGIDEVFYNFVLVTRRCVIVEGLGIANLAQECAAPEISFR